MHRGEAFVRLEYAVHRETVINDSGCRLKFVYVMFQELIDRCIVTEVHDPHRFTQPCQEWAGLRGLDKAFAENRLTEYRIRKAWADPIERRMIIAIVLLICAVFGYLALAG